MSVHKPAAELTAEIVNAAKAGLLDRDWVEKLLARELLPIRHRTQVENEQLDVVLSALTDLVTKVVPVFEATDHGDAAARLNTVLESVDVRISVSISKEFAPHLHYDGHSTDIGQRLAVNCLVAIASVLADSGGSLRLGLCASCGDAFVDFSRSGRQRFCSRRCATRAHVQHHRSKQLR